MKRLTCTFGILYKTLDIYPSMFQHLPQKLESVQPSTNLRTHTCGQRKVKKISIFLSHGKGFQTSVAEDTSNCYYYFYSMHDLFYVKVLTCYFSHRIPIQSIPCMCKFLLQRMLIYILTMIHEK